MLLFWKFQKGKQTEYAIGKYLREAYGKFIPEQYTPDVVYSISTNYKRTKMSLELVLASLFPPLTGEKIATDLNWQPVPFNIEDGAGIISVRYMYCINFVNAYYKYVFSQEARSIINNYKNLYIDLTKAAGFEVSIPRDVAMIYVNLKCKVSI